MKILKFADTPTDHDAEGAFDDGDPRDAVIAQLYEALTIAIEELELDVAA